MRCVSWAIAIAGATGCSASHSTPLEIPMNIVVTDGVVQVYMDAVDLGNCDCAVTTFPTIGACTPLTDANPCDGNPYCTSCITDFGIEVNEQRLVPTAATGNSDPRMFYGDAFPPGDLSLVVAGCGHPSTRISLDGAPFLQVSAVTDHVDGTQHVSWTTDAPASSALVTIASEFSGDLCRVQGVSDYTFGNAVTGLSVQVQALDVEQDVVTEFGTAAIWRGGSAEAQFPPPPPS
jgi:hypothetical protein